MSVRSRACIAVLVACVPAACGGRPIDPLAVQDITVTHVGYQRGIGIWGNGKGDHRTRSFAANWNIDIRPSRTYVFSSGDAAPQRSGPIDFDAFRFALSRLPAQRERSAAANAPATYRIAVSEGTSRRYFVSDDANVDPISSYAERLFADVRRDQYRQGGEVARTFANFRKPFTLLYERSGGYAVHPLAYRLRIDGRGNAELRIGERFGDNRTIFRVGAIDRNQLRSLLIGSNIAADAGDYPISATDEPSANVRLECGSRSLKIMALGQSTWPDSLYALDRGLSKLIVSTAWRPPLPADFRERAIVEASRRRGAERRTPRIRCRRTRPSPRMLSWWAWRFSVSFDRGRATTAALRRACMAAFVTCVLAACGGKPIDPLTVRGIMVRHDGHRLANDIWPYSIGERRSWAFDANWFLNVEASNTYVFTSESGPQRTGPIDFAAFRSDLMNIPVRLERTDDSPDSFTVFVRDGASGREFTSKDSSANELTSYAGRLYSYVRRDQRRQRDDIVRTLDRFGKPFVLQYQRSGGYSLRPFVYWLRVDSPGTSMLRVRENVGSDRTSSSAGSIDRERLRTLLIASHIAGDAGDYPMRMEDTSAASLRIDLGSESVKIKAPDRSTWPDSLQMLDRGLSWLILTTAWKPQLPAEFRDRLHEAWSR